MVSEKLVNSIGVKEITLLFWRSKLFIVLFSLLVAVATVIYSLTLENKYTADTTFVSARNSENSLGQSAAQIGQLASLAGFSFPTGKDNTATDLAILESRTFLSHFIERHNVKVPLFAGMSWDNANRKLVLNPEIYDESSQKWTRKVKAPYTSEPSAQEAVREFKKILNVQYDSMSGIISLSIEFYSPELAQLWVTNLINDLNTYVRHSELESIEENIKYLENKTMSINNAGMKTVFYSLLEEQQKKVMLAMSEDAYVFRVIDGAVIPEMKSSPQRALICVGGAVFGFLLSLVIVLFRAYWREN